MSDIAASTMARVPGRQLLAEFTLAAGSAGGRQLVDQVMDALQEFNLQPAQLERIQQVLGQAAARGAPQGGPAADGRLGIRIWVLSTCAPGRDWGFFLLEKGDDAQRARSDTDRLVELFLYQEDDSSPGRARGHSRGSRVETGGEDST